MATFTLIMSVCTIISISVKNVSPIFAYAGGVVLLYRQKRLPHCLSFCPGYWTGNLIAVNSIVLQCMGGWKVYIVYKFIIM